MPFSKGDGRKIQWDLRFKRFSFPKPLSQIQPLTQHKNFLCEGEIPICPNDGPHPFQRGYNIRISKCNDVLWNSFSVESFSQIWLG